ncbi:hypothetical protein RBXJA2T_03176 [Rubrivivax benzoatilyticus JA2 = ATCC BAA-35]|nr:hypothetical protein RBXJA2T_03176 [Rubrivivax benzoatilyticus JA2 = ATCC BAA-35]
MCAAISVCLEPLQINVLKWRDKLELVLSDIEQLALELQCPRDIAGSASRIEILNELLCLLIPSER